MLVLAFYGEQWLSSSSCKDKRGTEVASFRPISPKWGRGWVGERNVRDNKRDRVVGIE